MKKVLVILLLGLLAFTIMAQDDEALSMPEAQTFEFNDMQINYYESEGEGTDLFFVHGNSASGKLFAKQFELLGADYHIVAIDLPGHGMSSFAPEEVAGAVYTLPGYAEVVVALAEALEMTEGVFVGASLGGHIVLEAVDELPDASGFVIYGTPPAGIPLAADAFLPAPGMGYVFAPEVTEEDVAIWIVDVFAPDYEEYPQALMDDMLATDGQARAMLGVSIVEGNYQDEIEIVANMEQPLAIFHGEGEVLVNLEYMEALEMPTLWNAEIQTVAGGGHYANWEVPDNFHKLLLTFVEEVTME